MKNLRIVFMGTPGFAVATLGSLLMNGFNVVGVVTAPDRPAGRGRQLKESAVKEFAGYSSLPVLQPVKLKDPEFISALKKLSADIFIVVAFRMLPPEVWKLPRIGTINLHASLLPQYRGAAPINHALINGEKVTGLTTFYINDEIDTGSILLREEITIFPFENAGDLHDRLMKHGAGLVIRTLSGIVNDNLQPRSQNDFVMPGEILKPAPKITPEFCMVDWNNEPVKIHNFIRGLAPYPCAKSSFNNGNTSVSFRIFESHPEVKSHDFKPGQFFSDGKLHLKAACNGGFLNICGLQVEGRKRMRAAEFLRGFKISEFASPLS